MPNVPLLVALGAILAALVFQMSPGAPESALFDPAAHETSRVYNHNHKDIEFDKNGYVSFLGGDQVTRLSGHLHHAMRASIDDNVEENKDDSPLPLPPVVILAHGLGLCHVWG